MGLKVSGLRFRLLRTLSRCYHGESTCDPLKTKTPDGDAGMPSGHPGELFGSGQVHSVGGMEAGEDARAPGGC